MSGKAAIIGAGVIGAGWAARFLLNGWDVAVCDPGPKAAAQLEETLAAARRSLPMLYDRALPQEGRLTMASDIAEAVAGAHWIQESAPERIEVKRQVLGAIEAAAPAEAIIGSSTSGFKPSELRAGRARPDRILVAHPFNPVYLLPLVEIVSSEVAPGAAPDAAAAEAREILAGIGMHPLLVRKEIDAHIADRFLEAVWREALWLVKDGVAETAEIDDAIRYGFGLRWAQMGLFETYRLAGGPDGMAHFLHQFGPALKWPWTKLMDVPELTDALVEEIARQSDAQSGALSIEALGRLRDDNLVALMRALKGRDAAVGAVIAAHEKNLPAAPGDGAGPLESVDRMIPVDWTDYNGHMNEGRYGQLFSDAADGVLAAVGAGPDYVATGGSFFTVDIRIRFLAEIHAGARIRVLSQVLEAKGKKFRLFHRVLGADGAEQATAEQLLIHVDLETRRAAEPAPAVADAMTALAEAHEALTQPAPEERL